MVDIRPFDPVRDAHRVAAFYNEEGYGPVAAGRAATASIIVDILAERAVKLFVVAEQHGRIIGTLGYARMSGRRVAPDGQLFAVMFLVGSSWRSGFLVGQLFNDSFERFAALGARSLRVEVDPANRRAFPLYVRVGFRLVGDGRPDEEGYLELVNHLPGIATALRGDHPAREGILQYDAQTIREARRQTLTSGVGQDQTGTPTISYDLAIDGRRVRAVAHANTGVVLSATIDGREIEGRQVALGDRPVELSDEVVRPLSGGFRAILQTDDGTIRVEHPRHLGALVVDPFPVGKDTPAGTRRPATRALTNTVCETGWVSTDGEIVRVVEFRRRIVHVKVTHRAGERITIFPWSGFRPATLTVTSSSTGLLRSARYVRGVWPRDFTDFEAAAEDVIEAAGIHAAWTDVVTGLQLGIEVPSSGQWRIEGPHLAHVRAEAALEYRYVPGNGGMLHRPAATADGRRQGAAASRPVDSVLEAKSSSRVEVAGRCSVEIDPREGVLSWRVGEAKVIGPARQNRQLGPLGGFGASMWFALQPRRDDPDLGAAWASPDPRLTYGRGTGGWWIEPLPDSGLILHARARRSESTETELVTYLAMPTGETDLWDPTAGWSNSSPGTSSWRAWTGRCRVRTADAVIEIDPISGVFPEILVRRGPFGLVVAMFSQIDSTGVDVAWHLRFAGNPPAGSPKVEG